VNDAALLVMQVRYERKQYWRNPANAVFSVAFPAVILLVIGYLNRGDTIGYLGNINFNQYYIPAISAFGIVGATYTNLAISVAIRRDLGLLKRVRGTPLPPWAYFGGIIANAILVSVLLTIATTVVGKFLFGVTLYPERWGGFAAGIIVGGLCFCALGLAISCFIPNADAAPAVANIVIFPVIFISGVFFPVRSGTAIDQIANMFPLRHLVSTLYAAFDPLHAGSGVVGKDLLIMGLWALGGIAVALRRFRWTQSAG
jgi:ABC-2 type transport system permease protein